MDPIFPLISGLSGPGMELVNGYRELLVKNLRSGRCSDNLLKTDEELPRFVLDANSFLGDKPLGRDDVLATETLSTAKDPDYWTSTNAKRMMTEFRELNWSFGDKPISEADKTSEEWILRVRMYLNELSKWTADGDESESEVFHQKCVLYKVLLDRVPNGNLKQEVLRTYISFLHSSQMQKDSFIEWYFYVNGLASESGDEFYNFAAQFPNPHFVSRIFGCLTDK